MLLRRTSESPVQGRVPMALLSVYERAAWRLQQSSVSLGISVHMVRALAMYRRWITTAHTTLRLPEHALFCNALVGTVTAGRVLSAECFYQQTWSLNRLVQQTGSLDCSLFSCDGEHPD